MLIRAVCPLTRDRLVRGLVSNCMSDPFDDTIDGFNPGTDKIDLTALHSDASHLLIETNGTANSVYLEATPGSFNAAADLAMSINTGAAGGVHASDFIF